MNKLHHLICHIKNGYLAKIKSVRIPWSNFNWECAHFLKKQGYIQKVEKEGTLIRVTLKYYKNQSVIHNLTQISYPKYSRNFKLKNIPKLENGLALGIYTTPKGLYSDGDLKKLKTGGFLLSKIV